MTSPRTYAVTVSEEHREALLEADERTASLRVADPFGTFVPATDALRAIIAQLRAEPKT